MKKKIGPEFPNKKKRGEKSSHHDRGPLPVDEFGAHLQGPGSQAAELPHAAAQLVAGLEEQDGPLVFRGERRRRKRSERPGGGEPGDAAANDGDGDELGRFCGRIRRAWHACHRG